MKTLSTRKLLSVLSLATMILVVTTTVAQEEQPYLTSDELPNAVYWLPAPAQPGSSQFMYDISQYYWGKEQRLDTARANKAIQEAQYINNTTPIQQSYGELQSLEYEVKCINY